MHPRELLIDTYPHISPPRAIEDLATEDAERRVPGAAHTVAELVAHMAFWQEWLCDRCAGVGTPMAQHAADGWPAVGPNAWPSVLARFLAGLERAASLEHHDRPVTPSIEFPPLANYAVRDALVHIAQHNAHHLGQIILLRQMVGRWPPPGGGWTW